MSTRENKKKKIKKNVETAHESIKDKEMLKLLVTIVNNFNDNLRKELPVELLEKKFQNEEFMNYLLVVTSMIVVSQVETLTRMYGAPKIYILERFLEKLALASKIKDIEKEFSEAFIFH